MVVDPGRKHLCPFPEINAPQEFKVRREEIIFLVQSFDVPISGNGLFHFIYNQFAPGVSMFLSLVIDRAANRSASIVAIIGSVPGFDSASSISYVLTVLKVNSIIFTRVFILEVVMGSI